MAKIIKLTENDIQRMVKKILKEDDGEEKGEYGRSPEEAVENDAATMNRKAFFPTSMSESKKFKGRKAN
jgi:hypothetical protein